MFRTGVDEAPYAILGTAVVVGYRGHASAVLARHVLGSFDASHLLISAHDETRHCYRTVRVAEQGARWDGDEVDDFALIELDPMSVPAGVRKRGRILRLDGATSWAWYERREVSQFFMAGYPAELNYIDYDAKKFTTQRVSFSMSYRSHARQPHCYELELEQAAGLQSLSGFSGAPVLSVFRFPAAEAHIPVCGIALLGTATSRRVTFLDIFVIRASMESMLVARGIPPREASPTFSQVVARGWMPV